MPLSQFPIDETYDWRDQSAFKAIHDAIIRRMKVLRYVAAKFWDDYLVIDGDYNGKIYIGRGEVASYALRPDLLIETVENGSGGFGKNLVISRCQKAIEDLCDDFDDSDLLTDDEAADAAYDNAFPDARFTLESWRQKAGLNAAGFTRRYPRTIESTDDPGTSGQVARLVNRNNNDAVTWIGGGVFRHNGSAWELCDPSEGRMPDVLKDYGFHETGDYVGPWIWNEIAAGLTLMQRVHNVLYNFPAYGKRWIRQSGDQGDETDDQQQCYDLAKTNFQTEPGFAGSGAEISSQSFFQVSLPNMRWGEGSGFKIVLGGGYNPDRNQFGFASQEVEMRFGHYVGGASLSELPAGVKYKIYEFHDVSEKHVDTYQHYVTQPINYTYESFTRSSVFSFEDTALGVMHYRGNKDANSFNWLWWGPEITDGKALNENWFWHPIMIFDDAEID
jgi:hypothetical protein